MASLCLFTGYLSSEKEVPSSYITRAILCLRQFGSYFAVSICFGLKPQSCHLTGKTLEERSANST